MQTNAALFRSTLGCALVCGAALVGASCGGSTVGGGASCNDGGTCPVGTVCNAQGKCVPSGMGGSSGSGGFAGSGAIGGTGGIGSGGHAGFGGSAGSVIDPVVPGAQPPSNPGAPTPSGAPPAVLAFARVLLGDTDREGNPDSQAWKIYGYNIDGIISTAKGSNHCAPATGALKSLVQPDGIDGIDNSFGANLVPVIGALVANPSGTMTQTIQSGDWTTILRLSALSSASDQSGILAALYEGAPRGTPPYWDGTDAWPVTAESVVSSDINQPKINFPGSYVAGGTWVSGAPTTLWLSIGLQGPEIALTINHAIISMEVTGTGSTAKATQGTIAGVLDTEQLIAELEKVAGAIDPTLCSFSAFEGIAAQIRQSSDIMSDGTNGDPTLTCNAISIGLGFDASAIVLGSVAAPVPPPPDPCAGTG